VAKLHRSLVRHGFSAIALHGDMDQRSRMNALESFRNGEIALLIASDVAARGLDIPDVSHVFNFDVPHHAEDYVHRIGRTGRAGRSGAAITISSPADSKSLAAIEKLIGQKIPWRNGPQAPSEPRAERRQPPAAPQPQVQRGGRDQGRGRPPRSAQTPKPAVAPETASAHLPAFLLRPVPVKAE
jgi:superfamily II DNA/RNA helicase